MENEKKTKLLLTIGKYLIFLVIMIVLNTASLNEDLQPFGFAIYFALVWCNQNILLVSTTFFLSTLITAFSQTSLLCTAFTILIFIVCYFFHYKFSKPLNIPLILVYSFFSQLLFFYFNLTSIDGFFFCLAYAVIGIIFTLCALLVSQAFVCKKFSNFNIEENVSFSLLLAVFALGLSNFSVWHISILQVIVVITLLAICKFSKSKMLLCAVICGLGVSLNSYSLNYLCLFVCYALINWIFSDKNILFNYFALLFIDLFAGLYINASFYHFQSLIALSLGVAIFYILSRTCLTTITSFFSTGEKKNIVENVVNMSSKKLNRRLLEMSEIFSELEKMFASLMQGRLSEVEIVDLVSQELVQKICQDCKDKKRCHRLNNKETMQLIKNLVFLAFKKGKLTLVDVEERFSRSCIKLNFLITHLNDLIMQYKKYEDNLSKADMNKLLIARIFSSVSCILQDLADDVNKKIVLETQTERDLKEEFAYEGISCREILIYQSESDLVVALTIKNDHLYKTKLTNIANHILQTKMKITSVEPSNEKNFSNVTLKLAPKYDIVFGVSNKKKAGSASSGDTHSFSKLDDGKFLFVLCDGMGSGDNAKNASELSIGIIENLYKAGFNSENVIGCANNLLTMASTDVFTAIDMGVIDLKNGLCDIIKIGAPFGFLKTSSGVSIIEAGSLPLGILEELKPQTTKLALSHGDNIILMTDGVLEAFPDEQTIANFIENLEIKNPQTMADHILNEALHLNNDAPNDDMTVFVVRILSQIT